jgi:hypothetical protein
MATEIATETATTAVIMAITRTKTVATETTTTTIIKTTTVVLYRRYRNETTWF